MLPHINLGPITINTFGLMFAAAFILGVYICARRFKELGRSSEDAFQIVLVGIVSGIVGARLYYLIDNHELLKHNIIGNIFTFSGMTWYGGLLVGSISVIVYAWRKFGMNYKESFDLAAPILAAGQALGRIGCLLSGDGDYGKPWDGPFAMAFPNGIVPTEPGVTVHPTPIYEALFLCVLAIVLWKLRDKFKEGILFAIYLIFIGFERFLVEFLRINPKVFEGLTAAQLESLLIIVIGAVWIISVYKKNGNIIISEKK